MEKIKFEKNFKDLLDKNFSKFSKYFDFKFYAFTEFNTLIFEINKCLILELNRAAITLTNNLIERLLKLALISNETGIGPIPLDKWNSIFEEANSKYGSIKLGNSIELCKKMELISDKEKEFLFNSVRKLLRNGFSHADSSDIMAEFPDETVMFQGSLTKPDELKEVSFNQKIIPVFQGIQMDNFAKENAWPYFDFVFNLILKIEDRLAEKFK